MSNYRYDVRSETKFKKDIKSSHGSEAEIAIRLCISQHAKTGKWPKLEPNGSDMTGEFIEDNDSVTSNPDFAIDGQMVEITRADVVCNRSFHQKSSKVKRCINGDFDLVFVNGYKAVNQPNYIRLSPKELEEYTIRAETKYGSVPFIGGGKVGAINKPSNRYDIFWFEELWRPLPALISAKKLPKAYVEILESTQV